MTKTSDSGARALAATVLIATRERPEMLRDTLHSIVSARHVPREIVVVDQSSVPNTELCPSDRDPPPITTAAMTSSSRPTESVGSPTVSVEYSSTSARPVSTPANV